MKIQKEQLPERLPLSIWDGWPDGDLSRDFTPEEVKATGNLCSHYSFKANGGYRHGSHDADSWQEGKKLTRQCLGVIQCSNPECRIIGRAATTTKRIQAQLDDDCRCGEERFHQDCHVSSNLWKWKGGVHFENFGHHTHPRPGQVLHLLPQERERFKEVVKTHPQSKPLNLITGPTELGGPGESVANISPALYNADRVSKERQKLIKSVNMSGGDAFIASFAQFSREHPGFVILSVIGEVTVICFQSLLMRKELFKERTLDGNINGMVNDAAHGWWQDKKALLMVTSTYCLTLRCWIPGVFSYTNGASAAHFKLHFLAVFQSIAREAEAHSIAVGDRLFAGVCFDFIFPFSAEFNAPIPR